jgi:CheY-like chemotaxis protein
MPPDDPKLFDPPAEPSQAVTDESTEGACCTEIGVLVVDDEHLVRSMLQLGLERDGFNVWSAASGREAIRLYRSHGKSIDVVLLDVRMPGLDGVETLQLLRELNPQVRACFMTGDTGAYRPEELRQRGAPVLVKPFHLDQLAIVLRRLNQGLAADQLESNGKCRGGQGGTNALDSGGRR